MNWKEYRALTVTKGPKELVGVERSVSLADEAQQEFGLQVAEVLLQLSCWVRHRA